MSYAQPGPLASRSARLMAVIAVVSFGAALVSVIAFAPTEAGSSSAPSAIIAELPESASPDLPVRGSGDDRGSGLGVAGGEVPAGVTVFDDAYPAVANLDPSLLGALRDAANAARGNGVRFFVTSGWRSREYQARLFDEAVATYGSREIAARWVATPDRSSHVSGDAVDIGPSSAWAWLVKNGAAYGLCQIYRNEPWHFELRSQAADDGCPPPYADPTQDPRMQP
jgi:D-alanyl-D-alanine carboxypeptidase